MNEMHINLLREIPDLIVTENESMSRHTTFKIGGPARLFLEAHSVDALKAAYLRLKELEIRTFFLGNGSNLLVSDSGIDGAVLKNCCNKISVTETAMHAEAGAFLSLLSSVAQKYSLSGLEFAYGIPGTIGGAIVMNAGAYGGEICDVLISSTYIGEDCEVHTIKNSEHSFGYRTSIYKNPPERLILSAEFCLSPGDGEKISELMRDYTTRRRTKQPLEFPSAGSTFKRPCGNFAGALIEQCGLKGFSVGGAEVSEKHAGFIINKGGATCSDVLSLIDHIQNEVLKQTGVELECEVCRI